MIIELNFVGTSFVVWCAFFSCSRRSKGFLTFLPVIPQQQLIPKFVITIDKDQFVIIAEC